MDQELTCQLHIFKIAVCLQTRKDGTGTDLPASYIYKIAVCLQISKDGPGTDLPASYI